MTRAQAAALLGVPVDARPVDVRRAWRMWARLTHPDAGGDAGAFDRLVLARDLLLVPAAPPTSRAAAEQPVVPQRPLLREVLRRPTGPPLAWAALLTAVAVGCAVLPAMLGSFAWAVPAAVVAALAAWQLSQAVLVPAADRAHRAGVIVCAWGAIVGLQMLASTAAGASLVPVLPLLALPLVALTSLLLFPGRGLLLGGPR